MTHDDAAFCFHCGDFVALIAHPQPVAHEECMGDLQVEMALAFPDEDEADWEPHFCDFPLCPCDANQNRLAADSADYYAQDREMEARMGWEVGTMRDRFVARPGGDHESNFVIENEVGKVVWSFATLNASLAEDRADELNALSAIRPGLFSQEVMDLFEVVRFWSPANPSGCTIPSTDIERHIRQEDTGHGALGSLKI